MVVKLKKTPEVTRKLLVVRLTILLVAQKIMAVERNYCTDGYTGKIGVHIENHIGQSYY